jgi:hypothetical protein
VLDDCHGSVAGISFAPVAAAVTLDDGEVRSRCVVDAKVEMWSWGGVGDVGDGYFRGVRGEGGCRVLGWKAVLVRGM